MKSLSSRFALIISGLLLISSCSFSGEKETPDFTRDYGRVIDASFPIDDSTIALIKKWYQILYPSGYDNSWLLTSFDIADMTSGSIFFSANAARESYQKASVDMMLTGSIAADRDGEEFDIRTKVIVDGTSQTPYYVFLEKFFLQGDRSEVIMESAKKYIGKWYFIDPTAIMNLENPELQNTQFNSLLKGYMAFFTEIQNEGFSPLKTLQKNHSLLISTSAGIENQDSIVYPVILSHTGVIDFLSAASLRYTGSGIADDVLEGVRSEVQKVSFSGVLSVTKDDPTYYSLVGDVIMGEDSRKITLISDKEKYQINLSTLSGSVDSLYTKKEKSFLYTVTLTEWGKSTKLVDVNFDYSNESYRVDATMDAPTGSGMLSLSWPKSWDGEFQFWIGTLDKSEYFETKGTLEKNTLKQLDGVFMAREWSEDPQKILAYNYSKNPDDSFVGKIIFPDVTVDINGRMKKEDFLLNASAEGMTMTVENKKVDDMTWKGGIQFPVGKTNWQIQSKDEKLTGLDLTLTSPILGMSTNLVASSEDWVRGPYSVTFQGQTVSSGSLWLLMKPKYFGFRIDTILPDTLRASYLEFLSMVDIKWDKDVKIEIPTDALPLDMSELSPKRTPLPRFESVSGSLDYTEL